MHAEDTKLNDIMRSIGKKANLASHTVLGKQIYGPGDIEGKLSRIYSNSRN